MKFCMSRRSLSLDSMVSMLNSLAFFLLLSLPGVKFFWLSPLPNIIALIVVLSCIFLVLVQKKSLTYRELTVAFLWIVWFSLFSLSFFNSYHESVLGDYVRIFFVFVCAIFPCICYSYISQRIVLKLVVFWSVLLSSMFWLNMIKPAGAGELSYLNFTMQVGMGVMAILPSIRKTGVFPFVVFVFLVTTVLQLPGRTAIISVFVLSALFLMMKMLHLGKKLAFFLIPIAVLAMLFFVMNIRYFLADYTLVKFSRLLSGDEPRFQTYLESIDVLLLNPFGVGFQQHDKLIGFYPHNIFLEIGLASGLVPMIFLFSLIFAIVANFVKDFKFNFYKEEGKAKIGLVLVLFYLFMYWNFSFEIGSAYGIFSLMSLFLVMDVNKRKSKMQEFRYI